MGESNRNTKYFLFFLCLFFVCIVSSTEAAIIVFDEVAVLGKSVFFTAQTRGLLFPEGGRVVEFYVSGKRIGTTLSGGDGFAFFEYRPIKKGIFSIEAKSGDESSKGVLVVVDKRRRLLFLEIDAIIREVLINSEKVKAAAESLKGLRGHYTILYVSRFPATGYVREWLQKKGFPVSAVLGWNGIETVEEWKEKGLRLYAIVASARVCEEVAESFEKAFSFMDTDRCERLTEWRELEDRLGAIKK
jgi:hypothetical protein